MSGVYKVDRKVDTVIVEMDIAVAEKLLEVVNRIRDDSNEFYFDSPWVELANKLENDAEVRYPSPLYKAEGVVRINWARRHD